MTDIDLFTLSIFPSFGVRVTDWLSIGGGAMVTYGTLDVDVRAPIPMEPTARIRDADDWAAAPAASVLIEVTPELRFGVTYVGETELELDGKIDVLPMGSGGAVDLDLDLAQAVRASLYWQATEQLAALFARSVGAFTSATKWHMIVGTRSRQVDHHAIGAHVTPKMGGTRQAGGDYARSQTKAGIVYCLQGLFIGINLDHAGHRRKQLFTVHLPVVLSTGKYRRTHEIALRGTLNLFTTTAQFATFFLRQRHIFEIRFQLRLTRDRPDLGTGFERVTHHH